MPERNMPKRNPQAGQVQAGQVPVDELLDIRENRAVFGGDDPNRWIDIINRGFMFGTPRRFNIAEAKATEADDVYTKELDQDPKRVEELADAKDCDVFIPADCQLTVDLDTADDVRLFEIRLRNLMESGVKLDVSDRWKSSRKGEHVVVDLGDWQDYTMIERLMLQVALGSDPKRESVCLLRMLRGQEDVSRLFKPRLHPEKKRDAKEDAPIPPLP